MTAAPAPRVRSAVPEDIDELVAILQAAYPIWPPVTTEVSPAEYLRWKMSPRGAFAEDTHTLVDVGGRIAALQLRWLGRVQVRLPDREAAYVTDTGADLAVHPDFRGQGLARVIAEHERTRLHTAGHLGFDTPSKSAQVQHMTRPDQVFRTLGVWTAPLSRRRRIAGAARRLLGGRRGRATTARDTLDRGVLEPLERFDERADELWQRVVPHFDLIRLRDAAYLNWRYAPPGGPSQTFAITEGDRMLGYAVFKPTNGAGLITELLVDPEIPGAAHSLLRAGASYLRDAGCDQLSGWLPTGHMLESELAAAGLRQADTQALRSDTIRLAAVPELIPVLRDSHARFHVTMGDFDFL